MDLGWLTLLAILDEYGARPAKRGAVVRDDELSKRIKGMSMNGVAANGKGKGKAGRMEDSVSARWCVWEMVAVEHFRRALTGMSVVPPLVGGIDLYVLRGDGSTLVLISSCCQHSMVPRTCTPRWWRLLSSILYVQKKLAETRLCVHRPNFFSGTFVIRFFYFSQIAVTTDSCV